MAQIVDLDIRPVRVDVGVDTYSDVEYTMLLQDDSGADVDLSDYYTAEMQIRRYPGAKGVYDELTTENGRIEIVPHTNMVKLKFPASVTEGYKFSRAVYDLYIIGETQRWRIAEGGVNVSFGVTRRG